MAEGSGCLCVILILTLGIPVVFITLNCVWLFPVMNNSKKKEPPMETRESLVLYNSNSEYTYECNNNLDSFLEKGAYETFNINMKQIHKFSTGLISILLIEVGLSVIGFITIIILAIVKPDSDAVVWIYCCYKLLDTLLSLLNLIFFIILSVYYYKGKYNEFKDFSNCYFFDYNNFMENYGSVFEVQKNYKKVFILDIIFICLSFCSNILNLFLKNAKSS